MPIKTMPNGFARGIGIIAITVPALIFYVAGSMLDSSSHSFTTGLYAAAKWLGLYLAWNIGIVRQQDWQVVERLGQFYEVKLQGVRFYCMYGIIDTIKMKGTIRERQKKIFSGFHANGNREAIDFTDGSAPVEAYLWYKNGRKNGTDEEIKEDIAHYAYTNEDPEIRIAQIAEDWLRPKFQEKNIDTASKTRADIVSEVRNEIARELAPYGLHFSKEPPIVIADIILTDEQKMLRQQRLRGQTTADEIKNESDGYRQGIEAIMYRRKSDGTLETVCDFETATDIWREQQTRKMLQKTGSNITIIADSASNVVKTLNIDKKGD